MAIESFWHCGAVWASSSSSGSGSTCPDCGKEGERTELEKRPLPETAEEALALHQRALALKDEIQCSFYELGQVIQEIRDRRLYRKLGRFSRETWEEYTAEHLGMHFTTADHLIAVVQAWPALHAAAQELASDPHAVDRLEELGVSTPEAILNRATWSKLYQIATLPPDAGELREWLLKALVLGQRDLRREVARRQGKKVREQVNLAHVEGDEVTVDPTKRAIVVRGETDEHQISFTPQQWTALKSQLAPPATTEETVRWRGSGPVARLRDLLSQLDLAGAAGQEAQASGAEAPWQALLQVWEETQMVFAELGRVIEELSGHEG